MDRPGPAPSSDGRRFVALACCLTLPAAAVSGCVGGGEDEAIVPDALPPSQVPLGPLVQVLTDAAGDAVSSSSDVARDAARFAGIFGCTGVAIANRSAGEDCRSTVRPERLGEGGPRVGVPADAAFDVLSASMAASASTLVVELELARFEESLDWIAKDTGALYQVCWDSDAPWVFNRTLCHNGAFVWYETTGDGTPYMVFAGYVDSRPVCTSEVYLFRGCVATVPFQVVPGTPGRLRWEIPRELMNETAAELGRPLALAERNGFDGSVLLGAWFYAPEPACCRPGPYAITPDMFVEVLDGAGPGEPFALGSATPVPMDAAPPGTVFEDPAGDMDWSSAEIPDIDILATTLIEDAENLSVAIRLAAVEDDAPAHVVWSHFGLPGRSFQAGVLVGDRTPETVGDACWGRSSSGWCNKYGQVPVTVERIPGAPGWVNFTFARTDLGLPVAGELVHSLWSVAYTVEEPGRTPPGLPRDYYVVRTTAAVDFGPLGIPMRLQLGEPPRTSEGVPVSAAVEDAQYDAAGPGGVCITNNDCNRFDLLFVEVAAVTPTSADVTLGLADLSAVTVPAGYYAVVYAAALRIPEGQAMVGYFRSEDTPGAFFCAQDTLVFAGTPLDPQGVVWSAIQGIVAQGQRAQRVGGGGSSNAGAITLHVPHECLGKTQPGALRIEKLGAGAFVIQNPARRPGEGSVERRDLVESDGRFVIASFAPPAAPGPMWYARDLFWNIFGAFLAVLTVLVTMGVFLRRRRLMKWYLDELGRIDQQLQGDALARARSIVALRKQLHQDIVRHRVSGSEYIRDRLRSSLTSARLVSLSEGYYGLPASVAIRLERTLDDGRLTFEEQQLIEKVMGRVKIPAKERALLTERLRAWADEDKSWG